MLTIILLMLAICMGCVPITMAVLLMVHVIREKWQQRVLEKQSQPNSAASPIK